MLIKYPVLVLHAKKQQFAHARIGPLPPQSRHRQMLTGARQPRFEARCADR